MSPPVQLSVVIPTFNNQAVLQRALESWRQFAAGQSYELLVIEDGCRDGTPAYLEQLAASKWGRRHLRSFHEDDAHELVCTNRGITEARGELILTWQDDMFLSCDWLVPELIRSFAAYPNLGLLSLSRGLDCLPLAEPVQAWEDLLDPRRLRSTIGSWPSSLFRLQEVDVVIRPWVVRRKCIQRVGKLDEAFRPTEWDEADLCFRLREVGWKTATHAYERLRAYRHLGSTTLKLSDTYKEKVLRNGRLFHSRWDEVIRQTSGRVRRTWWRRFTLLGWLRACWHLLLSLVAVRRKLAQKLA